MTDIKYDLIGYPLFIGENQKFMLKLKGDILNGSDEKLFSTCTHELREAIENNEISKDLFTSKQLAQIEAGNSRI
ncbi:MULTISPECIES: HNH endonuclease [Bacillus]|uniref:HNH endonuclease n=1 Tax=Bacillus TaxID=1386 RepID=UPI0001A13BB2|nr:HNH endonuclease [Bacillus pseudomycoides]EEM16347.1 hypothetical protein bpmyx0001_27360 [Bacillus pseudomycoides DSM 12442]MED1594377.1 HNH endonuclease [Bacillus pseudomycoides]MED4714063.1 HNH endonuclease [Bacillus pseudomycoides]